MISRSHSYCAGFVALLLAALVNSVSGRILQEAYLKAGNTGATDYFGYAVAISGDTVVAGAPYEDSAAYGINQNESDNSLSGSGAAYVYLRTSAGWIRQAYLKASNPDADDQFGYSVAISGDTIVVGAIGESSSSSGVNGSQGNNDLWSSGAAYVFVRQGSNWSQQAYLKASNPARLQRFGWSVAISGDSIAIGTPWEDSGAKGVNGDQSDHSMSSAGAAYVFARQGSQWTQQAYLKASNTMVSAQFGTSIAISGNTIVVGARAESSASKGVNGNQLDTSALGTGAAYVFTFEGAQWLQRAYLKASNSAALDNFGCTVGISGDTIVVGALAEDSSATWVNGDQNSDGSLQSGACYVFARSGTIWSQQGYLKPGFPGVERWFGESVAVDGDMIVVGAAGESSGPSPADNLAKDSGAAYAFKRQNGQWAPWGYLKPANNESSDGFGRSVAISGSTAVCGATGEDSGSLMVNGNAADNSSTSAGAAYVLPLLTRDPGLSIQITGVSQTARFMRINYTFEVGMPAAGWKMWRSADLQSWSPLQELDFLDTTSEVFFVNEISPGEYRATYSRPAALAWPGRFFVRLGR